MLHFLQNSIISCAEIRNYPICQQKVLLLAYFFEQTDILVNLVLT